MIGLSGEKAGNHTAQEPLQEGVRMSYFPFFGFGVSGSAFLGRPTGFASLIKSTVLGSYMFVLPTLRAGSIPKARIRAFTVSKCSPVFSAISNTVNSVMLPISVKLTKIFRIVKFTVKNKCFVMCNFVFFINTIIKHLILLTKISVFT